MTSFLYQTSVLYGSVASSFTGSFEFFLEVSLSKTPWNPSIALVKHKKDMNDMSCCPNMTEIMSFDQSFNQSISLSQKTKFYISP